MFDEANRFLTLGILEAQRLELLATLGLSRLSKETPCRVPVPESSQNLVTARGRSRQARMSAVP
jgi:hypothetical protein